jgi:hypothetical protein
MSLTLTDTELADLTRRSRPSAQIRVLRHLGIEHRTRPDGSVVVDRLHYESLVGAKGAVAPPARPKAINWEG